MSHIFEINRPNNKITLGIVGTTINIVSHTASRLLSLDSSKNLESVSDLTSWIAGTTDHISVTDDSDGTVTLDLDTNTKILLGSFNGIFLEKLDFTISEAGGTVTGSLEKDGTGDLIQRFSDGYTTLDCTPAKTINLTGYVGSNAVPKEVFVYILQSAKTIIAASNSDWPGTEHIKIANLLLKDATTTGSDGGALVNRNWNDFASAANGEGHITHIEKRIRQEPSQWDSGIALTLKNSAGAALTIGNSSTAVEIVLTTGKVYQLHRHTFPAFDMYTTATDDAHVVNQPTDRGGAYETTADLVSDVTHYDDGSASGAAIGTNKYFNLVIWGVQNRSGEASHVMINLPTGQYTTEANATSDVDGTSVFDVPALFKGMGFLIARLTFRKIGGGQWTYIAQEDLRGQIPPISAGVSVTASDHALLANLAFASAGHTGFQAQGDVLDDLNTLGAVGANSEFLVGTGAGALAWENAAIAATSMGLGIGNSPQFTAVNIGHTSDTTITRASAGNLNIEGNLVYRVGGTDVSIADGGTGQGTAQLAINALSAVSGATNEYVLTKDTGTGNAVFKVVAAGADEKVKIDVGATADYIGAANNDGVLRTTTGLSYADGGNFVTLGLSHLGFEALTDPGVDKIPFWDDSETAFKWLTVIQGVQINGTILQFDVNSLTEDTTPATNDYMVTFDVDHGVAGYEHKKVLLSNLAINLYHDGDGFRYVDVGGTPTKVYTKYLTDTLDADAATDVAHGITGVDNILHCSVLVFDGTANEYRVYEQFNSGDATKSLTVNLDGTNVIFTGVGTHLQGQKYRIKIDYIVP